MAESPDKTVQMLRQVLQYAQLVGFMVPGGGIAFSIGAGGLSDLLSVFFGGRSAGTVDAIAATGDAIKAAVSQIEGSIDKAIWSDFTLDHLAALTLASDEYKASVQVLFFEAGKLRPRGDPEAAESWRRRLQDIKVACEEGSPLLKMMHWVRLPGHAMSTHQVLPLYLLAAMMYANYCQLALSFETVEAARDRDLAREDWRARHPDGTSDAGDPEPASGHIEVADLVASPYYRRLSDTLKAMLSFAEPAVGELERVLDQRDAAVTNRREQFELKPFTGPMTPILRQFISDPWFYQDLGAQFTSEPMDKDQAELAMEIARGRAVSEVDQRLTAQLGIGGVGRGSLNNAREIVHTLRTARDLFPEPPAPAGPATT